eukprot:jgi/Botrbrau1/20588/Bobra.113_1s0014.1
MNNIPSFQSAPPGMCAAPGQPERQCMVVHINGKEHSVWPHDFRTTLSEFLRFSAHVTSSKIACGEGGCGACAVIVSSYNSLAGKTPGLNPI